MKSFAHHLQRPCGASPAALDEPTTNRFSMSQPCCLMGARDCLPKPAGGEHDRIAVVPAPRHRRLPAYAPTDGAVLLDERRGRRVEVRPRMPSSSTLDRPWGRRSRSCTCRPGTSGTWGTGRRCTSSMTAVHDACSRHHRMLRPTLCRGPSTARRSDDKAGHVRSSASMIPTAPRGCPGSPRLSSTRMWRICPLDVAGVAAQLPVLPTRDV